MEDENEAETSALHARRKSRSHIGRLSCCFHPDHRRAGSLFDFSSTATATAPSPNRKSPSSWIRSKHFRPRMGKHRRYSSADFSYDPLSYALNFEDNSFNEYPSEPEDTTCRNFSSRLRASPPPTPRATGDTSEPDPLHSSSRVAAIAEVVKNLELSATEMRMSLELPRPPQRRSEAPAERTLMRCQS